MRRRDGLIVGGVGVLAVLVAVAVVLSRDDGAAWRAAALRSTAAWVESTLSARQRALAEAAARLAALEARPPEVVARTLAALGSDPAFVRLYALDASGRIVVSWPETGGPNPGAPDPSAARRAAVKAGSPRALHLAGVAGVAERVEMLVAVPPPAGAAAPELYLVADVDASIVADGLTRLEGAAGSGPGVLFALVGEGGLVVHPRAGAGASLALAPVPAGAAALDLDGLGLRLAMRR